MVNYPFDIKRWKHYKKCQEKYIQIGDCDPSYPILNYIAEMKRLNKENRFWLSFLYSSCYSDATAWAMFITMPEYTKMNENNLNKWWKEYKSRFIFTTDRAKVKNFDKVTPMFLSYRELVGENQETKFNNLRGINDCHTYDNVYKFLMDIYYVGRFSMFLLTETINVLTRYSMEPTSLNLVEAESCRNGLCYALGADDWLKVKGEQWNGLTEDQFGYLYNMLKKLIKESQQENSHLDISYWNVETSLCAYKKYFWKTRYMGYYLDRQLEGLYAIKQNFPEFKRDWKLFEEGRKLLFDRNYLGEIQGWNGIRKYMMGLPKEFDYKGILNNNLF